MPGHHSYVSDDQAQSSAAQISAFLSVVTYALLGFAGIALVVGIFLFGRRRWAVGLSAIGAAIIAKAAAVAAPVMHGPVILACALLAIVLGVYAAMAGRVLLERNPG